MKRTTQALIALLLLTSYSYVAVAQDKKNDTKSPPQAAAKKKPAQRTDCCNAMKPCKMQSPISFYNTPHDSTTLDNYDFNFFSPEVFDPTVEPEHTKLVYHYTEGEKATTVTLRNKTYRLNRIHMHNGNEHKIDGKQHDFEIHMVYGNTNAQPLDVVVVGIVGDYKDNSSSRSFANQVCAAMKSAIDCKEHNKAEPCLQKINVSSIIRSGVESGQLNFPYYSYYGSLTTGVCATGVNWIVKTKPVTADKIGLEKPEYQKYFPGPRATQPIGDRHVQLVSKPR
jgi:carbonic anhydrase